MFLFPLLPTKFLDFLKMKTVESANYWTYVSGLMNEPALSLLYCFTMRGPSIATSWQIVESSSFSLCGIKNRVIWNAQWRGLKSFIPSWHRINVARVPLEVGAGRMWELLQRSREGGLGSVAKQQFQDQEDATWGKLQSIGRQRKVNCSVMVTKGTG